MTPTDPHPPTESQMFWQTLTMLNRGEAVSASILQKKYHIGYIAARRILDGLEVAGYIQPQECESGTTPRTPTPAPPAPEVPEGGTGGGSDTPEVDKQVKVYANEGIAPHRVFIAYVEPDFARALETRLWAVTAERDGLLARVNSLESLADDLANQLPKPSYL